ncbi:NACHT domain-containing protein [Micromonospora zamorensis]|uniref:NACHT domain-containing protein n=1 Tax=Micromonospora zamorensis TaxID=709883 RepID=UPI003D996067
MSVPAQVQRVVKTALNDLGSTNGHHTFEQLCVAMAQKVISQRIVLATGPVSSGGDQGRDAETLWTEAGAGQQIVLVCTTQRSDLKAKIKKDVATACARGPVVNRVVACTTADVSQDVQHYLEDWAHETYSVNLQVWDGGKIAAQLAAEELFWVAETFLQVPRMLGPSRYRQIADMLEAQLRVTTAARRHPWNSGQVPIIKRNVQRVPVNGVSTTTAAETPLFRVVGKGGGRSVLLTGEPGTGKTTAAQMIFQRLAAGWLDRHRVGGGHIPEPGYVPVLVRARDLLTDAMSFSEMLCRAACAVARPMAPLGAEIFADRVDRSRWLVIIDGLDEVQDNRDRSALIELIADHGSRQGTHRFFVLARPIAPSELEPLTKAGFLPFSLPRFSAKELDEFAHGWFAHRPDGKVLAAKFVDQIQDPHLVEMLRVPLFAGLALSAAGAGVELPRNRHDLLEAFFTGLQADHLADGSDAASRTNELTGAEYDELLSTLAERALEGDSALVAAAVNWYRHRFPNHRTTEAQLRHHLVRSGVLVAAGEDLMFAHQALAEYLAARLRAAAMPTNGSAIPDLVRDLKSRVRANVTTYTVVLYLRSHPEFASRVVRGLLAKDGTAEMSRGGLLAAAGLILDGIPVDATLRSWVINQLADNAVAEQRTDESVDFLDVLSQFGSYWEIIQRFRQIVTSRHVGVRARCRAAVHLGLIGHREFSESKLVALLGMATQASSALAVIDALTEISDDHHNLVRSALQRWIEDPGTSPIELTDSASRLFESGDAELADRISRQVLQQPSMNSFGHLQWALSLLLEMNGSKADALYEQLKNLPHVHIYDKAAMAQVFAEAGATRPAIALAQEVLQDPSAESDDEALGMAVQAWARSVPPADREIVDVIRAGSASDTLSFYVDAGSKLALNGLRDAAMELLTEVLHAPEADMRDLRMTAIVVIKSWPAETAQDVISTIYQHPQGGVRVVLDAARYLRFTVPASILPEVLDLVADPAAGSADAAAGARVLIAAGPEWAVQGVDAFMRRPTVTDPNLVTIAQELVNAGHGDLARGLALRVLSSSIASTADRDGVTGLLCDSGRHSDVDLAVATVINNPWLSPTDRLATAAFLDRRGHHRSIGPIVHGILTDQTADSATRIAALAHLDMSDAPAAKARLEAALENTTDTEHLERRRLLAWLSVG